MQEINKKSKTKKYSKKIIALIAVFIFVSICYIVILNNYPMELYYGISGKIIKKQINHGYMYGYSQSIFDKFCLEEMPKECRFINAKEVGSNNASDITYEKYGFYCWDCDGWIVDCYYGCPKSYEEH